MSKKKIRQRFVVRLNVEVRDTEPSDQRYENLYRSKIIKLATIAYTHEGAARQLEDKLQTLLNPNESIDEGEF